MESASRRECNGLNEFRPYRVADAGPSEIALRMVGMLRITREVRDIAMPFFSVVQRLPDTDDVIPRVYLIVDNWNDWYTWYTMFTVVVTDDSGGRSRLGSVKIGQRGMGMESGRVQLPTDFDTLDQTYFSLGQDENYYETASSLDEHLRDRLLNGLQDCAFDLHIFANNASEPVMESSLLRDIPSMRVGQRFAPLSRGNAELTRYQFSYSFPPSPSNGGDGPTISINVEPHSLPPTNIHVLIGRNGVGKTRCFDLLSRTLLGLKTADFKDPGTVQSSINGSGHNIFGPPETSIGISKVIAVSFSAFDSVEPIRIPKDSPAPIKYQYVGLKKEAEHQASAGNKNESKKGVADVELRNPSIKSPVELVDEFVNGVEGCRTGVRRRRWHRALRILESDPLFEEADISSLAGEPEDRWKASARRMFATLSSGHAIVLLTITRLVELVEEKSLVLMDEPESHLHPPLISAFIRAVSDLLIQRNGVALIATHSPVVLQEVPRSCVWVLSRFGRSSRVDRPEMETFGENVSVLTREVFGLEVLQSGFSKMVSEVALKENGSYNDIILTFGDQLGAEGKVLARSISSSIKKGTYRIGETASEE